MPSIVTKATQVYHQRGLCGLARSGGMYFGSCTLKLLGLPEHKIGIYNGVAVRRLPLLGHKDNFPDHERELIDGIRLYIRMGDRVLLIGAGSGSSSVVAARQAGPTGHVTAYEGARDSARFCADTARLNGVEDRMTTVHAIVSKAISLSGNDCGAPSVDPTDLPQCDALVMDCEGAERDILQQITIRPRTIIVETHSHFGSPDQAIRERLDEMGYRIDTGSPRGDSDKITILCATYQK